MAYSSDRLPLTTPDHSHTDPVGKEKCPDCKNYHSKEPLQGRQNMLHFSQKALIILLLLIGTVALFSIVILSQQLISRHFKTEPGPEPDPELEAWELELNAKINALDKAIRDSESLEKELDNIITGIDHDMEEEREPLDLSRLQLKQVSRWLRLRKAKATSQVSGEVSYTSTDGLPVIHKGILFSPEVEQKIPKGQTDQAVQDRMQWLREASILSAKEPSYAHCGRSRNRYLKLQGGTQACARHRAQHTEFVVGEVMAFYLARLLGMTNTPVVVLGQSNSTQFSNVYKNVTSGKDSWEKGDVVAIIDWVNDLGRTPMPPVIRDELMTNGTVDAADKKKLVDVSDATWVELAQWSDLYVYDYITGNYDRVASMQDGAENEERPDVLKETIRNLPKSMASGGLWFLDNESAFLSAYEMMYVNKRYADRKFYRFHKETLHSMCFFREETVDRLRALLSEDKPEEFLLQFIRHNEPLFDKIRPWPTKLFKIYKDHFKTRLKEIDSWVKACQKRVETKSRL